MRGLSLLFPGVWVHELAHAAGCMVSGVPIHKMEVHAKSGVVVHCSPSGSGAVLISLAPLLVGTLLAWALFTWSKSDFSSAPILGLFWGWLGFSVAFHSIPSAPDLANIPIAAARRMGELCRGSQGLGVKLVKTPLYGGLWVMGLGLSVLGIILNATLLVRAAWGLGVWFLA